MLKTRVKVEVPATSANLGPGFDSLGMALDIWNTVEVRVGNPSLTIVGEDSDDLRPLESNLAYRCVAIPFQDAGEEVPEVSLTCHNRIPLGRGLGSSSAAAVAGLVAGNELSGNRLAEGHILELAARTEGHPDNVAPALLGGCQVVVRDGDRLVTAKVPVPDDLTAVVFIPDVPMPTSEARSVLPEQVSRHDAVYNIGRAALLVRAFATGDLTHLAAATDDRLHQPARQSIFPAMKVVFRAALNAGGLAVFLSGAGSSVLALARGREMTIGYEMAEAASKAGVGGTFRVTRPTNEGARVVESD